MDNTTTLPQQSSGDSNSALVARVLAGESEAFEELVTSQQSRLMRLICRLIDSTDEAEDVLQEVFVAAYQGLRRFRQQSSFTTWVTTIAVNKCRTHRRRAVRRQWLATCLRRDASDLSSLSEETVQDDAEEVRKAVHELSARYREPVVLHYFEHLSVADVASVLGLKTNTVEVRLSRGRRLLRTALDGRISGDQT